jgi:predicted MFS family arabinose efflux permease
VSVALVAGFMAPRTGGAGSSSSTCRSVSSRCCSRCAGSRPAAPGTPTGAWERRFARHRTPLADLELFTVRSYALGAVIGLLYFAGFTTLFVIYTLFLQSGLGYSALLAGLAVSPFAVGSAGAAVFGGRIVNRYGRPLVVAGLVLVATGLGAMLVVLHFVPGRGAGWADALPLLLAGIGSGLVISPNQTLTLVEVPKERGGSAGAVLQTGQRIGTAIGIAAAAGDRRSAPRCW